MKIKAKAIDGSILLFTSEIVFKDKELTLSYPNPIIIDPQSDIFDSIEFYCKNQQDNNQNF